MCVCVCYMQPVKEEREAESEKRGGEEEESTVVIPHKPGKKMKMVVCHVTLLDGSQFQCEVEVCVCVSHKQIFKKACDCWYCDVFSKRNVYVTCTERGLISSCGLEN